ncbi:UNVERIFIED_CONTAM: FACT complex subunit [Siphonaria sp. JEL0065]|nr:FACT complex subunit [Siphonaria sp. JEL0065]
MFLLPKPDELHTMFVIQLDPPLRQGQTRYPFLVFQFDRDEEIDAEIKLDQEAITAQYDTRLRKDYDGPVFMVVSEIFKALANINIITPGMSYKSTQNHAGVKCALKANEAFLYPLEKSFVSVPKPATLIPHADVNSVTFSRVNSASSSTKTIEMKISTTGGDYAYTSISREEYQNLAEYCRNKKLRVTTEIGDGQGYDAMDTDDEEEGGDGKKRKRIANMKDPLSGGGLEDSESEDEDFQDKGSDDSDVDLEYDTDASSDGSDEEDGSGGSNASDGNASEEVEEVVAKSKSEKKEKKEKKEKSASTSGGSSSKGGEPEKKKVKKDPNAPKGASSSFILYSNATRNQIKEDDPSLSMTDISKKIGAMWKEIGADEKKIYEDLAAKDKERYKREMAAWEAGGKKADGSSSSVSAPKEKKKSTSDDSPPKGGEKVKSSEFVDEDD